MAPSSAGTPQHLDPSIDTGSSFPFGWMRAEKHWHDLPNILDVMDYLSRTTMIQVSRHSETMAMVQSLRLGEAQSAQLVKWHEGHVKQLKGLSDAQRPLAQKVQRIPHFSLSFAFTPQAQSGSQSKTHHILLVREPAARYS